MLKIASKQLIPAATSYMGEVASTAAAKTAVWKASPPSPKQSC
mgnify:CR=1 FL=1